MITNREELQKTTETILATFNVGINLKISALEELNKLLGVSVDTPLSSDILQGSVPDGIDPKCFTTLLALYNQGKQLMAESSQKMTDVWAPIVLHIIETKYAEYKKYHNTLYYEGITGLYIGIHLSYSNMVDALYNHICLEMNEFLSKKGIVHDHP